MTALTILTYHSLDTSGSVVSVRPQSFADHMSTIARLGFRGISIREAIAHRARNGTWPERSVAITFDDGFANFHEAALPVLVEHEFGATLYVVTGHVGGTNDWAAPPESLGRREMLDWRQLAELAENGVEIGAHTRSHPDLRSLSSDDAAAEIRAAKEDIARELGLEVESFAYPFGFVDTKSLHVVRSEYRSACTTVLKRAGSDDSYSLPRLDAYYIADPVTLERAVLGKLDSYITLRRIGRSIRSLLPL